LPRVEELTGYDIGLVHSFGLFYIGKRHIPLARSMIQTIPSPALSTAQRAYELYEDQGRREGHATQEWLQAEREVAKKQA
jgi:hypothetical protein